MNFERGFASYLIDLGRRGIIKVLSWSSVGRVKFRIKVANTRQELTQQEFEGTTRDNFLGQEIDTNIWVVSEGAFTIIQNNGLKIQGTK